MWRSNFINDSATFDNENDEEDDAAREGTRAVERAINGASAAAAAVGGRGRATAAVAGVEVNGSSGSGSYSLGASERGGGGGGGGDGSSTSSQGGRILFYHKPTLANVPAGDIPDAVPVYLGCPRGNMALGLPLNQAWQGEEHQVCAGKGWGSILFPWRRLVLSCWFMFLACFLVTLALDLDVRQRFLLVGAGCGCR